MYDALKTTVWGKTMYDALKTTVWGKTVWRFKNYSMRLKLCIVVFKASYIVLTSHCSF
jgi:hypothetical protein